MPQITINKVKETSKASLPVFEEIAKRIEAVKRRAFELFERRGRNEGRELDDWLTAERELLGWPAAELREKNGNYEIEVTLPGFDAQDVEVTACPSEVIIHASTEEEKEGQKGNVVWTEFGSNDVYRRFELPKPINLDKVTSKLENGILRISAPASAEPKTISAIA